MNRWVDQFVDLAGGRGINAKVVNRVNGWPETAIIGPHRCFTKSASYLQPRNEYFLGVDPRKLEDDGDLVVLCGGREDRLQDVFIFPWNIFFAELSAGEPINTYEPPREYFQYKLHVRHRADSWQMAVQGAEHDLGVDEWRYSPDDALALFGGTDQP